MTRDQMIQATINAIVAKYGRITFTLAESATILGVGENQAAPILATHGVSVRVQGNRKRVSVGDLATIAYSTNTSPLDKNYRAGWKNAPEDDKPPRLRAARKTG